jgi:hypothetical protein
MSPQHAGDRDPVRVTDFYLPFLNSNGLALAWHIHVGGFVVHCPLLGCQDRAHSLGDLHSDMCYHLWKPEGWGQVSWGWFLLRLREGHLQASVLAPGASLLSLMFCLHTHMTFLLSVPISKGPFFPSVIVMRLL